jgi:hypothetical protein
MAKSKWIWQVDYERDVPHQQEDCPMTVEAQAVAICEPIVIAVGARAAVPVPANDPTDPELGWAIANPDRAMLFLFVSPRDCAAVDELMAL